MVQGYYTLEEAARILGMSGTELNQMAQRKEVRAFQDRGSWRFRTQDIEELARRRGLGSNPDLPIGEAPKAKPHDSPAPRSKSPGAQEPVFPFALGSESEQVEIGQEIVGEASGSKKSGSKSKSPRSPTPKPGSDSDVRLVAEGSDVGFRVASDSDVKLEDSGPKTKPSSRKSGRKEDSGVRLVPMDAESDSDVKIIADSTEDVSVLPRTPGKVGSDSDVRLEPGSGVRPGSGIGKRGPEDSFLTEEIDLDAELRKAEEAAKTKKPLSKTRPAQAKPATAPFELAKPESGVRKGDTPKPDVGARKADTPKPKKVEKTDSSSEFDLAIEEQSSSSIELDSGELSMPKDDEVSLGDVPAGVSPSSDSGINLQEPADSGISLEQRGDSSDEIEFELSLDAESTPKPVKATPGVDSSSEFELTLEDSARLAPLEEEGSPATPEGEKDIFETDFEVPALEEESGSEAVALDESDTDLESSDFDLALGEEDAAAEEESGSQVVALEDEEEVDEAAATVARPRRGRGTVAEDEAGELVSEREATEEEIVPGRRVLVTAAPADWGIFTPVVLMVSVLVMFLLGLMSFEMLHGMWGYHQPNRVSSPVVRAVAGMFGADLPAE